jgi:AcrR family transcriptional regulator
VFCLRGFHGASVRDAAAAAHKPTASLLHHFPTKQKLYAAVLVRIAADLDAVVAAALDSTSAPVARLERLCRATIDWCNADHGRSGLLVRELLDNPSRLATSKQLPLAPVMARIETFIREGQGARSFRKTDPTIFVAHLVGSASYFAAAKPTLARIGSRDQAALSRAHRRELVRYCVRAIATEAT